MRRPPSIFDENSVTTLSVCASFDCWDPSLINYKSKELPITNSTLPTVLQGFLLDPCQSMGNAQLAMGNEFHRSRRRGNDRFTA
jgi:hypothetical protein